MHKTSCSPMHGSPEKGIKGTKACRAEMRMMLYTSLSCLSRRSTVTWRAGDSALRTKIEQCFQIKEGTSTARSCSTEDSEGGEMKSQRDPVVMFHVPSVGRFIPTVYSRD